MFDVKRDERRRCLRNPTVLTGFCLKNRDHLHRFSEIPEFRVLLRHQRTFVRLAAQFADMLFERRVKTDNSKHRNAIGTSSQPLSRNRFVVVNVLRNTRYRWRPVTTRRQPKISELLAMDCQSLLVHG